MKKRRNTLDKNSLIINIWNFIENFVIAIIWLTKFVVKILYCAVVNFIQNVLRRNKKIRIGKGE